MSACVYARFWFDSGGSRCGDRFFDRGGVDLEMHGDTAAVVLIGAEEVAELAHLHFLSGLSEGSGDA